MPRHCEEAKPTRQSIVLDRHHPCGLPRSARSKAHRDD